MKERPSKRRPGRAGARVEESVFRRAADGVEVEVTVSNAADRPLFVTVGVRQVQYDPGTKTLTLWFSDHGRDPEARDAARHLNTVPETRTLGAGERLTFAASVPQTLTRLVPHPDDTFHFETLDLSDLRSVVVHVAVADRPFYFNPKGGNQVLQLKRWGEDLMARAKRARERPKGEAPTEPSQGERRSSAE
jgi:hypothetical protein